MKTTKVKYYDGYNFYRALCGAKSKAEKQRLIKSCKNINVKGPEAYKENALMIAAMTGETEIVKLLVVAGAKLNLKVKSDAETALISAVYYGHADIVETLIKAGVKVNLKDRHGLTALMWAVRRFGYYDNMKTIMNLLIAAGAKVNLMDNEGHSVLMWACMVMSVRTGILKMLIEKGAKLDAKDKMYGRTALMIAASNGETAKVKLLIKKGAKLDLKDNSGRTALMYAEANKHADIVEILKAAENATNNEVEWKKMGVKKFIALNNFKQENQGR